MKPQAYEALQKAKALFRHPAEVVQDDIPEEVKTIFPDGIRKPKVHLLPTEPVKFTKESMEQEHKKEKQIDKYVEMSVAQACEACIAKGIKKPADIAKETNKDVNQIYTALWHMKKRKQKARAQAKEAKKFEFSGKPIEFVAPKSLEIAKQAVIDKLKAEWDKEPTAFEDAHRVVLHDREWYEKEIEKLATANTDLLLQIQELKAVIKYLERKVMV